MGNSQFEWHADEDEDLISIPGTEKKNGKRRNLWFSVVVLVVISTGSLLAVRYFGLQQRRLEEAVHRDVEASFDLWERAIRERDEELYVHLLTSSDRGWRQTQRQLFEKDMILQRTFLSLMANDWVSRRPEVTLSPDWQRATVTFEQVYNPAPVSEFEGPVRLQHTAVFEDEDSGWVQIAPDADFWGDWLVSESDMLVIHYPARDAELARRIGQRLEADLQEICAGQNKIDDRCAPFKPFVLTMSTDAEAVMALESAAGTVLPRSNFQMPAPTIAGLPADEMSFQAYYHGYTRELLEHVRTEVGVPTPLPEQLIRTLCFNHPSLGPKLYKYVPAFGVWEAELPERNFRFLLPLAKDQGLILDEMVHLEEPGHSRLINWREGTQEILLDEVTGGDPYRAHSPAHTGGSYLLLRRSADNQSGYEYKALDLTVCGESGCQLQDLPGYALWSPNGQQTILQIDSKLYLGDADGQTAEFIGRGFNPFWLNDEAILAIQFIEEEGGLRSALVMNQVPSGTEQVVLTNRDLAQAAGIDEESLSMRFVGANPGDPSTLLVQASGLKDYAGEYFIFSARLAGSQLPMGEPEIVFQLEREGSPGGDIGQLAPSGYLPFSASPDGRWLLISELSGTDPATRTFLLHDLQDNETRIISEGETVLPAQFPSYDWSDDGRWLVIAGDKFFRLMAPEYEYEQLVPHDFDYCGYARWSD